MADDKRTGPVDRRTQVGEEEAKHSLVNKRPVKPPYGRREDDLSVKIRRLREDRQAFREYFTDQVIKINKANKVKNKVKGKGILGLGLAVLSAGLAAKDAYAEAEEKKK
jgi:hypothetical protein